MFQDYQLAALHVGIGIQSVLPEIIQQRLPGPGISNVDDLITRFQALADEGSQNGAMFGLSFIDETEVVTRLQVLDLAGKVLHVDFLRRSEKIIILAPLRQRSRLTSQWGMAIPKP